MNASMHPTISFPYCPQPPDWTLDWSTIQQRFPWLQAMDGVPQEPAYHAEGDVLIHTRMVAEALTGLEAWRTLPENERVLLFAGALLHDVGKPACTQVELDGRISSRGHARKGEIITRRLLWTGSEGAPALPLSQREYIARLVRHHGLPLRFLDHEHPERLVMAASQSVRMDHLALIAEADVRGRICADQRELLVTVDLFRDFCREQQCYTIPRQFATDHSRFEYFHKEERDPSYSAYDTTAFEVVLLSGLPGAGKDTWLQENLHDWPVISLDKIRRERRIDPEDGQGEVVQAAREWARELMRQRQSFVWNATNVTHSLRRQLIQFFVAYGARVRIVYIDAPFDELIKRNRARESYVPEAVIYRLLDKLEVPDPTEAHLVEWVG